MDFKNPVSTEDQQKIFSLWKDQGICFFVKDQKVQILGVSNDSLFLDKKIVSDERVVNIQYPGYMFELEGSFSDQFFKIDKVFKVNRRESFRVSTNQAKTQVVFNVGRQTVLAKIEDISIEGMAVFGPLLLKDLTPGEVFKNVKVILEEKEVVLDFEVKRVVLKDGGVKLGASFVKTHSIGGSGHIMNFINNCYRQQKK